MSLTAPPAANRRELDYAVSITLFAILKTTDTVGGLLLVEMAVIEAALRSLGFAKPFVLYVPHGSAGGEPP